MNNKMTDAEKLEAAIQLLGHIYLDACMAKCGDWDRGDEGFDAQQMAIEQLFDKLNICVPDYDPE